MKADVQKLLNLEDVVALLRGQHEPCMDPVKVSMTAGQLVKCKRLRTQLRGARPDQLQDLVHGLLGAVAVCRDAMRPRQLSSILWALGKMAAEQPYLRQQHSERQRSEHTLLTEGPLLQRPLQHVDGVNIAGAVAQAAEMLLTQLVTVQHQASARDIAQALYGCALCSHQPAPALMHGLMRRSQVLLPRSSMHDLSMTSYSLGLLRCFPGRSWVACFEEVSTKSLHSASTQGLANIIWGLAAAGVQLQPAWVGAFFDASLAAMPYMRHKEVSITAWALSQMQLQPPDEWLAAIEVRVCAHLCLA